MVLKDRPGLEVIKLEFILKLKIKRNQPMIALYFEFETVLKFYNLEACYVLNKKGLSHTYCITVFFENAPEGKYLLI